jgi:hypothetical protein
VPAVTNGLTSLNRAYPHHTCAHDTRRWLMLGVVAPLVSLSYMFYSEIILGSITTWQMLQTEVQLEPETRNPKPRTLIPQLQAIDPRPCIQDLT